MTMHWTDYINQISDSDYYMLYGFFVGSVAWKTGAYAGMLWVTTRIPAPKWKWLPDWCKKNLWRPSFKDSRIWMGIVIAAMLVTFPLGKFSQHHLALQKMAEWNDFKPAPAGITPWQPPTMTREQFEAERARLLKQSPVVHGPWENYR
jgi:hypothetical protein